MVRPGASPAALDAFEASHQVSLPDDMRAYLLRADGMVDWEIEADNYFHFAALEEVKPVTAELPHRPNYMGYFYIADYLIHSWSYAIHLTPGTSYGSVAIFYGDTPMPVAVSFTEFLRYYLHEPDRLLAP